MYVPETTLDSFATPPALATGLQTGTGMAMIVCHRRQSLSASTQILQENHPLGAGEDERRELDAVAAALANTTRLHRLIVYIGEKYFAGETDKLHEYGIATEVFGRSRSTFNAGEDAIVRVEAHRLRKRLKEYYETEGKDHPIQLSIPPGTYIPVFTRRSAGTAPSAPLPRVRWWPYAAALAALALSAWGVYALSHRHRTERSAGADSAPAQPAASSGAAFAEVPLRIMAGYTGKPQIDSAGAVWQPDRYFQYGGTWDRPQGFVARTSDPMLFDHWRNGDFSYDIPLRPGVYELHLYFVATELLSGGANTFTVGINGDTVLSGFDVNADALGANIADERIFRDVSPAGNGLLHLGFDSERGSAALTAFEVLPGTPHRQLPIRLVMQATSYTDHSGQFWHPDDYYMNGYTSTKRTQIAGTPDPDVFASERYGHFTYAIPVDTRDRYTLILHFAEFYFGQGASGVGGTGSRVFRVLCNGNTLLDNFDIYKEAGSLHALTKTFYHLQPTAQGKLNITFEPIVNNATVSGIEVIDEAQ
jgi:hypothetical protein